MRALTLALIAATAATTGGCAETYDQPGYASQYSSYRQYDYNRPDPRYNGYYADQYYVDNPRYRERRLSRNDRVYVGRDGRYYCRRGNGTTGLVIGAAGGALLGNQIEKQVRTSKQWEMTVRYDDGTTQVFKSEQAPFWHQGDRVRLYEGQLQPV